MKSSLSRALLLIAFSIPSCAAVAVVLQALLAWLAPDYLYFVLIVVLFVVGVVPWLLLTYIAASKRFDIGWHWAAAAFVSLLVVEASRLWLAGLTDINALTNLLRSSCAVHAEAEVAQLQGTAVACAVASWSSLTSVAFIRAVTAGLLLAAVAWIYEKLVSGEKRSSSN